MRSPNEVVWCLPNILVTASPSICPLNLTNASPLLPMSWSSPFHRPIKGKDLLVASQMMCTRAFHVLKLKFKELNLWLLRGTIWHLQSCKTTEIFTGITWHPSGSVFGITWCQWCHQWPHYIHYVILIVLGYKLTVGHVTLNGIITGIT